MPLAEPKLKPTSLVSSVQASSYEDGLRRITTARHSAGHNYNLLALPAASLVQHRSGSGPGCTGEGRMELCSSADAEGEGTGTAQASVWQDDWTVISQCHKLQCYHKKSQT